MAQRKKGNPGKWSLVWVAVTIVVILGITKLAVTQTSQTVSQFNRMTPWLIARAGGVTALVLLTLLVSLGLVLGSVPNKQTWRLSRYLLPAHRYLALFMLFFLGLHIVTIVLDPFAKVGLLGALVPGLSSYRTVQVAIGTLSFFALLLVAVTARYPTLLPNHRWLTVHRISLYTFMAAWTHGALTGADTPGIKWLYVVTGAFVIGFVFLRYWIVHQRNRLPIKQTEAATERARMAE
ncbi:hypothetical protein [Alicyclobacillus mengziensis]|uniref:Ferric oxidoreductase domain-containing protein n=1 Tax=Alicyclobacillus mengziensis TaxID=2931921 RepID=A0A9X7W081_9BACL|nr:hypothetical protein [Alicyclobacillus mengziensis]QSO48281.1 hypothetical protein JZ786_04615 [Alicyclobacillus mengziensis]